MSHDKLTENTIENFCTYVVKFDLLNLPKNVTIFENNKGLGRFFPDDAYINLSRQAGANTTTAKFNLGYRTPNYSDYILSGAISSNSVGNYSQTNYTILTTGTGTGSIAPNGSLVLRIISAGTVQATGSIIVSGYHGKK